jgi:hypothetical protein
LLTYRNWLLTLDHEMSIVPSKDFFKNQLQPMYWRILNLQSSTHVSIFFGQSKLIKSLINRTCRCLHRNSFSIDPSINPWRIDSCRPAKFNEGWWAGSDPDDGGGFPILCVFTLSTFFIRVTELGEIFNRGIIFKISKVAQMIGQHFGPFCWPICRWLIFFAKASGHPVIYSACWNRRPYVCWLLIFLC